MKGYEQNAQDVSNLVGRTVRIISGTLSGETGRLLEVRKNRAEKPTVCRIQVDGTTLIYAPSELEAA